MLNVFDSILCGTEQLHFTEPEQLHFTEAVFVLPARIWLLFAQKKLLLLQLHYKPS